MANPIMSETDLLALGKGQVVYLRTLSVVEVHRLFPQLVEGLPASINTFFSLFGADGEPLALTDTRMAAVGHAIQDDMEIAGIH